MAGGDADHLPTERGRCALIPEKVVIHRRLKCTTQKARKELN
jgi:hypothetical protein